MYEIGSLWWIFRYFIFFFSLRGVLSSAVGNRRNVWSQESRWEKRQRKVSNTAQNLRRSGVLFKVICIYIGDRKETVTATAMRRLWSKRSRGRKIAQHKHIYIHMEAFLCKITLWNHQNLHVLRMENYLGFHLELIIVDINYTKLRCSVIKDSKHILLFVLNL